MIEYHATLKKENAEGGGILLHVTQMGGAMAEYFHAFRTLKAARTFLAHEYVEKSRIRLKTVQENAMWEYEWTR